MLRFFFLMSLVLPAATSTAWCSQEAVDTGMETNTEADVSDAVDQPGGNTETEPPAPDPTTVATEEKTPEHGLGHKLLFYLPNRFLDIFDFVRLRARIGPGLAVGARVTKPISVLFGGYASVYAGLPGPRMAPKIKLPVGIDNYAGLSFSFLGFTPEYSPTEIGAGCQLFLVGADIGVDPIEIVDLALGFLFIDLRGDDL